MKNNKSIEDDRLYLAAHAPSPQGWFVPKISPRPSDPESLVLEDFFGALCDDQYPVGNLCRPSRDTRRSHLEATLERESEADTHGSECAEYLQRKSKHDADSEALRAWNKSYAFEQSAQWPWAYADAVLSRRIFCSPPRDIQPGPSGDRSP